MTSVSTCGALLISALLLSSCASTSTSSGNTSSNLQEVSATETQQVSDIRQVLATDCSNLPTDASSLNIESRGNDGKFDLYDVEGMLLGVSDVDFGPDIMDAASVSIHDSWGCGGIVHFRPSE